MPEAAISRDAAVDHVLPVVEIPALLISLTRATRHRATTPGKVARPTFDRGESGPTTLTFRPAADDARSIES